MSKHRLIFFAALSAAAYVCSAATVSLGFAFAALTTAILKHLGDVQPWRYRLPAVAAFLRLPRRTYVGPPVGLPFERGRASLAAARGI